jgi:hypothetical protein
MGRSRRPRSSIGWRVQLFDRERGDRPTYPRQLGVKRRDGSDGVPHILALMRQRWVSRTWHTGIRGYQCVWNREKQRLQTPQPVTERSVAAGTQFNMTAVVP